MAQQRLSLSQASAARWLCVGFVCQAHKLIVEVDGGQHGEERGLMMDAKRDAHFRSKGYRIARLWDADVNRDPDAAADTVWALLQG